MSGASRQRRARRGLRIACGVALMGSALFAGPGCDGDGPPPAPVLPDAGLLSNAGNGAGNGAGSKAGNGVGSKAGNGVGSKAGNGAGSDAGSLTADAGAGSVTEGVRARRALRQRFARAYHLDTVLGQQSQAARLYREIIEQGDRTRHVVALAHLRLAALCRANKDRRCAMRELDWLINQARLHPALARRAERQMVDLLHPQAGRVSALTRGPPVSFTRLRQVPPDVAQGFRDAEKELLRYARVSLSPQLHNVDAVVNRKRAAMTTAVKAYAKLLESPFPNAVAAALFRQGSLYQDFAEALGRVRLPEELLPRVAARLRARFHAESVVHFRSALERYRKAAAIDDVIAERWRQAAAQSEAQLGRMTRRR